MGRSDTTHVLEIESGIGEPAFIPLSLGSELQPISVGRKGMWRIESARVLDVHAFLYFDGNALFLQSADERAAAVVEGQAVGTTWTEIEAGCQIEVGQARLRFRSLLPEQDDHAETHAMDRAPVAPPPHLVPPTPSAARAIPPKPERPFQPGELASRPDDESTRIAPLDGTKRHSRADLEASMRAAQSTPQMPAGGGMPASAPPVMMPAHPMPVMHTPYPGMVMDPNAVPGTGLMPHGGTPSAPAMMAQPPHGHYASGPHMLPADGGGHGLFAAGNGGAPYAHPSHPPSGPLPAYGHGSMPPGSRPMVDPNAPKDFATRWKEMPGPRRLLILLSPVFVMSAWMLLVDDPAPTRPTRSAGSASAVATARPTAPTTPVAQPVAQPVPQPVAQPGVPQPAPQPGVPQPAPQPGVPQPGVPQAVPQPGVQPGVPQPVAPPGPDPTIAVTQAPAPPPMPANAKTYERAAVDAYLAGDYATAARIYTQLGEQAQPPSNIVYMEAARIIRAKLDAGAPR